MKEFVITKVLNAPIERVWKAFTDPNDMKHWWGPKGAKILKQHMDVRVGGVYHYGMSYADQEMWGKYTFTEIHKPTKLVWTGGFSDEHGGVARHPLNPNWPINMHTTLELKEEHGKTHVTIRWHPINPTPVEEKTFEEGFASMNQGWMGTFENLEVYLASK